jgi:hypothetical protein
MRTSKERLMHLLKLAAEGESARAQLVQDLSAILIDWPSEYAQTARLPFETLLEKTIREADAGTSAQVADLFARRRDTSVVLLNRLFFAASAETRDRIVARNDGVPERAAGPADFDEDALVLEARCSGETFPAHFARGVGLSDDIAEEILRDESGRALAIACKGAHARRATFSALAVLTDASRAIDDSYTRLASYDAVPLGAAEHMLAHWRAQDWATRNGSRNAAE